MGSINYIVQLNEYVQKSGCELKYDVGSEGPHIKTFTQRVILNGKQYPEGVGKNKKEARQNAAKHALECVSKTDSNHSHVSGQSVRDAAEPIYLPKINQPNFRCWIYEQSDKNQVPIVAMHSTVMELGHAKLCCKFVLNGTEYPSGSGRTKKEAKEEAARLAYQEICSSPTSKTGDQSGSVKPSSPQTNKLNQDMSEAMSPANMEEFQLVRRWCLAHFPQEAKQAWSVQSDWDSKTSGKSAKSEEDDTSNEATSEVSLFSSDSGIKLEYPSEPPKEEELGSKFLKEYDCIEPIGRGGFGHVYKARLKHLDVDYAVKIVPNKKKALREAATLAKLLHPNIVRYYTSWIDNSDYEHPKGEDSSTSQTRSSSNTSGQYLYIQMELCETKNLEDWINKKNSLHQDLTRGKESLDIMRKIICGVEYIHSKNLVHRDLKPANIMVGSNGVVKIVDFGLVTTERDQEGNVTEKTISIGTKSFMAPEQSDKNIYNNKVDIFALGLVYFLMLWNISCHEKMEIWDDLREQRFPADTKLFPKEQALIVSMLHKNPKRRPSAKKIQDRLKGSDLSVWSQRRKIGPKWTDEGNEVLGPATI